MIDVGQVWEIIRSGGIAGLLFLFIVGLHFEWWVTGKQFHRLEIRVAKLEKQKDRWESITWSTLTEGHAAVATAISMMSEGDDIESEAKS